MHVWECTRTTSTLSGTHQASCPQCQHRLQVLLSDADSLLRLEAYSTAEAQPSTSQPSTSQNGHGGQEQHPLSLYHDYLSFLFRRQPEAKPEQMLELSYRDYLQVGCTPLIQNAILGEPGLACLAGCLYAECGLSD